MTGYELLTRLKKTRKRLILTATEQALYHELGSICNDVEWDEIFLCSNDELCKALNISENTLVSSRLSLIQCGLIYYRSGKSRRKFGEYSFEVKLTTSNFEVDTGGDTGGDTGTVAGGDTGTVAADYNKYKLKLKPKKHSEGKPSGSGNSFSGKKKKIDEVKAEHWQALVKVWFDFNKEKLKIEPSFKGSDPKDLKSIADILKKRAVAKGFEWSEQVATDTLKTFLEYSYNDEWLKSHFLLSNLLKQFDKIITPQNVNRTTKNGADATDRLVRLASKLAGHTSES